MCQNRPLSKQSGFDDTSNLIAKYSACAAVHA